MNLEQANAILDRHKEGSSTYSMLIISKALFLTGDIPNEPESFDLDGEDTWSEEPFMAQS